MIVVEAGRETVTSWMEIVREVEPLFGPMPDFEATLVRNIARGCALCVCDSDGEVLGGALFTVAPEARITWLAVRSSMRRAGVGRALVVALLRRCASATEVTVDTFGEGNVEGQPARRLYESFGFRAMEHLERGPEGGTRQRFRLHPNEANWKVK
jgi:ribosomal protein S18 acetylase RimI-like enzyme